MIMEKRIIYLFSEAGLSTLGSFINDETLFAFDLDGTLAPIVTDPAMIRIPLEVKSRLLHLAGIAFVAIITGRARSDALKHLGFSPGLVVGNHGAEGLPGREDIENKYIALVSKWSAQLKMLLPDDRESGIIVEKKGATLSIHYRNAPNRAEAYNVILDALAGLSPPPRLVAGKYVLNIIPIDAPNKGEALSLIMHHRGYKRAVFIGDDETDEDVFRIGSKYILGIRVGETPLSAARIVMQRQSEITRLLDEIIMTLQPGDEKMGSYQ